MITIGIDEAGRGCLAGNVVAATVILPSGLQLHGLTDSKKISIKKRQALYYEIINTCQYAIGFANAVEIDNINILQATLLAMKRAIKALGVSYDKVLVDGNKCPNISNCQAIIKGDLIEPVISAASIVAKVVRDKQMQELDLLYPRYGFAKHKSYATKEHLLALRRFGAIANIHRFSFAPVKNLVCK